MRVSKKTMLIAGLVIFFLTAVSVAVYMMWKCMDGEAADGSTEPFDVAPVTAVEYYAMKDCPHCKVFDTVWEAVDKELEDSKKRHGLSMQRWDVKTDEGNAKAKEAGVTAFPHVQKTSPDGNITVFNGKRNAEELTKFCTEVIEATTREGSR